MQDSLMQENNQWMYTVSLHTATGTCQHSSLSKQSVLTKTLKKLLIKKLGQHDKILTKDQTIECELWPCKYELCIVYEKWFLVQTKLKCFFTDEDLALLCMYCKCNVRVHDPNCAKGIDLNFRLFFWKPETFKYSRFRCYKSMGVFLTWTIKIIFLRFLCHFQSLIFKSSATIETVRYIFQKKTRLKWLSASKAAQ